MRDAKPRHWCNIYLSKDGLKAVQDAISIGVLRMIWCSTFVQLSDIMMGLD
jgi:hypothetical protein